MLNLHLTILGFNKHVKYAFENILEKVESAGKQASRHMNILEKKRLQV